MPKTSRDYNPAAIMLGLDEILVRHGFYMGWGELASWDLAPRLTHHDDGSATLTAFHDPGGAPAVRYHRSENGTISLHTASTSQPIPEWLFPPNSYHPKTGQRRKPTRRDAPRLPVINHTETGRQQQHLMLTCTELMLILRHQLMLRLAATAAAVASDYLPNRIIQYAMTQVSSRLRNECIPNPLIPARHVAVEAMLRTVHPSTCRELLRQQLDPARELTPLPPYEEPPLREREPPPTPKPPNRLNAHYSLPVTRPRDSSVVAAAGQLNTDLLDQLLDAETLETLLSLTAPKDQPLYASLAATQIRDYNKVHSSMPAYGTMTKTSPSLTRIYLQDRHLSYMPPRSPQDITERLRGEYADRRHDMTDSQWQHFQRLANMPHLQGARYEPLRITAEAVALAGQPEPTDRALLTLYRSHQILFDHMYRHLSLTRQTQDAAWKHTLHTFLDPKTQTPSHRELELVLTAMTRQLRKRRRWPPGTWSELVKRSLRLTHERLASGASTRENIVWFKPNPAPPWCQHERGGYLLTPLNTSNREETAALLLGFRVQADMRAIIEGHRQVFLATAPDHGPAALRYSTATRSWALVEIACPAKRKPPPGLEAVAEDLTEALRAADPNPVRALPNNPPHRPTVLPPQGKSDGNEPPHTNRHRVPTFEDIAGEHAAQT